MGVCGIKFGGIMKKAAGFSRTRQPATRRIEGAFRMTPIVDPMFEWMNLPLEERKSRSLKYKKTPRTRQPHVYTQTERERRRHYKIARKYGLSKTQWDELFSLQGNCCAVCGRSDSGSKYGWTTDHCHLTKRVRGILCHGCNLALGGFRDSIPALKSAIQYLEVANAQ